MTFGHLGTRFGHIGGGGSYSAPAITADVNKTASDTIAPKITEGTAARLPQLLRTDTLAPKITEGTAALVSTATVSDTLSPALADAATVGITLLRSDTLAPKIDESRSLDIGGTISKSANDNLATVITEVVAARSSQLTRTDTLAPKITDATTAKAMTVGDGIKPKITEGTTLISVILTRADTLAPKITDAGSKSTVSAVPGNITDLVVTEVTYNSALMTYTAATAATSHQYRYSPTTQAAWTTPATTPVDNIVTGIAA